MEESAVKDNNWVVNLDYDLKRLRDTLSEIDKQWKQRSIFKLLACITDTKEKAYKPQAVSFGPYHNGEDHLTPMEEHKHRALAHFLSRKEISLQVLVDSLSQVAEELRNSYHPLDSKWNDDGRFLQMMLLDGCFMLEIFLTNGGDNVEGYASNDPIFSKHGKVQIMPYIKRDMLMLENQLPMLVLDKLHPFGTDDADKKKESVNDLIVRFWPTPTGKIVPIKENCLHVLDVVRRSHIQCSKTKVAVSENNDYCEDKIIRSATELSEAGIVFKKSKTFCFTDISFTDGCCGGILSLPVILVDDATESKFLNMLAFERLHVGEGNEVTSYVFLMDNIIENEKDIALLHDSGIIQNATGSAKVAADLFNSLSKDTTLDPASSLSDVHNKVNEYCERKSNKWRANFWHTYFTTPWTLVSLIAAILLFALTIIQTYYTIYPYYNPRESSTESDKASSPRFHPPHNH